MNILKTEPLGTEMPGVAIVPTLDEDFLEPKFLKQEL
jgi:hypothetical protein